jgi:hypothetical protein
MKDKAPLGSPFIEEARCVRSAKVAGRAANPCGKSSPICPQGVVVEIKRKIVEGKEEKSGGRKRKYEITTGLFSRREHHILGL